MRNKLVAALLALAVATPALAEQWDFVLTNQTGKGIKLVEVSPTGAADWQKNQVDPDTTKAGVVAPGARTTIHFDRNENICKYDVRATFADDTTLVWTGINVCDNAYVTLKLTGNGVPSFTAN